MADKQKILELDISTDAVLAKAVELKSTITSLRDKMAELKKSGDTTSETYIKTETALKQANGQFVINQKVLKALSDENGNLLTVQQKVNMLLDEETTSIGRAKASITEMNALKAQLNVENDAELALLQKLNAKIEENTTFQKKNGSEEDRRILNIGKYKEGLTDAIKESGLMNGAFNALGVSSQSVTIGFKQAQAVVGGVKDVFNEYKLATDEAKIATEANIIAQKASTEATKLATVASERATAVGFQYAAGKATQTDVEEANSVALIANKTATEAQAAATVASTAATNASANSLKLLRIALISTGIGAIVVVLGFLISYLTSTQEGIDKITSVTRPLQAIFQSLIGVAQNLGKGLFNTFSNPKKAMSDLADFVKTNLINRFKAFGVILDGLINLDFKKVTNGFLQAGTGVENLTGKIANAGKATGKFLTDAAAKGSEIDKLTKQTEISQLAYNKKLQKTNDLIDEQRLKSKDASLTFKEREIAAQEIIRLTKDLGKDEEAIIATKIKRLKIEQSLSDVSRKRKQEMIDLEGQLNDAQDRGVDAELEQMKVIAGAKKEAAAQAKEAAQKAQEDRQKALADVAAKYKAELDLFISTQGFKAKSLEEELKIAEQIKDKQLEIAQAEFNASKKTQTDKLKLLTEQNNINDAFLKKQVDAVVNNASRELSVFIDANKTKIQANKFLTDELVAQEIDRLNRISEAEANFQTEKLTNGVINEQEYQDAIKAIDDKFKADKEAVELQKSEADKEKKAVDLENKLAEQQLNSDNDFAFREAEIARNQAQEIAAAEKNGAEIALINAKYAAQRKQLDKSMADFKFSQELELVQGIKGLFGEQSKIGKAAAIAEIFMNTFTNASKAFQQAAVFASNPFTAPLAVNANIQGGIIVATGAVQAAKVAGLKFEKGDILSGPSHTNGGIPFTVNGIPGFEAEGGEAIINKKSTAIFLPLLSAINEAGGGKKFAGGGVATLGISSAIRNSQANTIDYDILAAKIGANVAQANLLLPSPQVAVTDINYGQGNYAQVVNGANH